MAGDKLLKLNDANFTSEVTSSKLPVLVDFGATWCAPCKTLGVTLDAMVDSYNDKVRFCYVDIQEAPMVASQLDVRSVPTLILFDRGVPKGSLIGNQPKNRIEELISRAG